MREHLPIVDTMESVHIGAMMDAFAERVQTPGIPKKQRRSIAEKRRIVEETLAAGASVARVARAHGVNANQVFQWRRLYRAGRLGGTGAASSAIKLLPVTVEASPRTLPDADRTRTKFTVTYASDPANVSKARSLVQRDLSDMQDHDVRPAELQQAKALLLRQIPLAESSEARIAAGLLARENPLQQVTSPECT